MATDQLNSDSSTSQTLPLLSVIFELDVSGGLARRLEVPSMKASDFSFFQEQQSSFLVVANYYDPLRQSYSCKTLVFSFDSSQPPTLHVVQELPTYGASRLRSFQMGGRTFLAVANQGDRTSPAVSSIYAFDKSTSQFSVVDEFETHLATDFEHVEVRGGREGREWE